MDTLWILLIVAIVAIGLIATFAALSKCCECFRKNKRANDVEANLASPERPQISIIGKPSHQSGSITPATDGRPGKIEIEWETGTTGIQKNVISKHPRTTLAHPESKLVVPPPPSQIRVIKPETPFSYPFGLEVIKTNVTLPWRATERHVCANISKENAIAVSASREWGATTTYRLKNTVVGEPSQWNLCEWMDNVKPFEENKRRIVSAHKVNIIQCERPSEMKPWQAKGMGSKLAIFEDNGHFRREETMAT